MNEATQTVPLVHDEINPTPADEARFWAKVNKNGPTMPHMDSPCWLWTAGTQGGYGRAWAGGKHSLAHRLAWLITNGPIPRDGHNGICALHRCDTPACVNPHHLFIGTNADNVRDMLNKGRGNKARGDRHSSRTKPECVPRGESASNVKLTAADVLEIRRLYANGMSQSRLASLFGVTQAAISLIVLRRNWKHLP